MADAPDHHDGHCLCHAVRFTFDPSRILWAGHCHCETCRRQCSAPVTSFLGVADGAWDWTGEAPVTYASSDHATRYFCGTCGTPMAYRSTRYPDEIHFYGASLADPASFTPARHYHWNERLPWLTTTDDLPR